MGILDSFLGNFLDDLLGSSNNSPTIKGPPKRYPSPKDYQTYEDASNAASEAYKMLSADQKFEGKKAGYNRTANIYEGIVSDLKIQFEKCIYNLKEKQNTIESSYKDLLSYAKTLENKKNSLLESLKESNPEAYQYYIDNDQTSGIIMIPKMKSINFAKAIYTLLKNSNNKTWTDGFIEGCYEAENEYNNKIDELSSDFLKEKEKVEKTLSKRESKLKEFSDDVKQLVKDIARLQLANSV